MTNQRCVNRSFQGYAFIQWNQTHKRASFLKGFVDAAPPGAFSIVDMTAGGDGEWKMWDNAAFLVQSLSGPHFMTLEATTASR